MVPIPLWSLLSHSRSPGAQVAWSRQHVYRWADFTGATGALASDLGDASEPGRWLLDVSDAYAFAVGLFGLARAGAHAVVPPNRQPATLREVQATCRGVVSDAPGLHPTARVLAPCARPADPNPKPVDLDPDAPLVSLFTSGTTGPAQEVTKSLRQLDEVSVLDREFGHELPADTRILASAPQQHLYGLLFRVLWPLASGRPFHSETILHAEELLGQLEKCDHAALVATPAHLRRLTGRGGLPSLRGRLVRVFSSGGPLDLETAAALGSELGEAPLEIFGSTETGGVGHRRQSTGAVALWEPLPSVSVRRDESSGQLLVSSPFVSVGELQADGTCRQFLLGDAGVVHADGRFELKGRADRVVKVGEKRLSLPDMETRLREHPWVADAALLVIEQGREPRIAAVLEASPAGAEALAREGRRAVSRALADHLSRWWDRVLLPRLWRSVPALPRDARGKTPVAALRALFDDSGENRPRDPILVSECLDAASIERLLVVPEDLAQLEGHFPGFPIVAGVVQLGWAMEAARALLGASAPIARIEALKFQKVMRPGDQFTLRVELSADRRRLNLRLWNAEGVFASGRCLLEWPR